jgi:hypothetical protein
VAVWPPVEAARAPVGARRERAPLRDSVRILCRVVAGAFLPEGVQVLCRRSARVFPRPRVRGLCCRAARASHRRRVRVPCRRGERTVLRRCVRVDCRRGARVFLRRRVRVDCRRGARAFVRRCVRGARRRISEVLWSPARLPSRRPAGDRLRGEVCERSLRGSRAISCGATGGSRDGFFHRAKNAVKARSHSLAALSRVFRRFITGITRGVRSAKM